MEVLLRPLRNLCVLCVSEVCLRLFATLLVQQAVPLKNLFYDWLISFADASMQFLLSSLLGQAFGEYVGS
jgi:hypothetical protein